MNQLPGTLPICRRCRHQLRTKLGSHPQPCSRVFWQTEPVVKQHRPEIDADAGTCPEFATTDTESHSTIAGGSSEAVVTNQPTLA